MCNLYEHYVESMNQIFGKSLAEVLADVNLPLAQVYPGTPGVVITADLCASKMTWGFPFAPKGKDGKPRKPRPVNNARTDKLASPFWYGSVRDRRCLIPVDRFAEADGPKGAKCRTWYSMPDGEQFHCAGVWRDSPEWGKVYSMIMTDAAGPVERIHDRMPVIIAPENCGAWLNGPAELAKELCVPWRGELQEECSRELWVKR